MNVKLKRPIDKFMATRHNIVANSESLDTQTLVTRDDDGYLAAVGAGDDIHGLSQAKLTAASDNETSAKVEAQYIPLNAGDVTMLDIEVRGGVVTFSDDIVASNVVSMTVDGTAITDTTYATSSAYTLGVIAGKLAALDSITTAVVSSSTIVVTPSDENVLIAGTITAGASQATITYADSALAQTDLDQYFDLTAAQYIDYSTLSASTGQVKLVELDKGVTNRGGFEVANA